MTGRGFSIYLGLRDSMTGMQSQEELCREGEKGEQQGSQRKKGNGVGEGWRRSAGVIGLPWEHRERNRDQKNLPEVN